MLVGNPIDREKRAEGEAGRDEGGELLVARADMQGRTYGGSKYSAYELAKTATAACIYIKYPIRTSNFPPPVE